jgi:hypothetical protein
MKSVAVQPLDHYHHSTRPVSEWLEENPEFHIFYVRACAAYLSNPFADEGLRCSPRVAFDAASDGFYFIFKQDNNGTCILVGENLPHVHDTDRV